MSGNDGFWARIRAALGRGADSQAPAYGQAAIARNPHKKSRTAQRVDEALFARVRAHFSEAQVVELTAAVALENFRSKFNVALGIEAQGFCVLR